LGVDGGANMVENRRFEIPQILGTALAIGGAARIMARLREHPFWWPLACAQASLGRRREKGFSPNLKEKAGKKTEFQTGGFHPKSFRR
jgi:hypothetical protein